MRAEFERVGGGAVLNNSPYDLAAAVLCLEEAGAVVTDAYGRARSATARCSARAHELPDVLRRRGQRRAPRRDLRQLDAGSSGCALAGAGGLRHRRCAGNRLAHRTRHASGRRPRHKSLADYTHLVGRGLVEEIRELAEPLEGKRVLHVSATAFGGGVSEILYTLVPLMRDVGLDADWQVILGREEFFNVTKLMHNSLQGDPQRPHDEAVGDLRPLQRDERAEPRGRLGRDHRPRPAAGRPARARARARASAGSGAATSTSRRPTRTTMERLLPLIASTTRRSATWSSTCPRARRQDACEIVPAGDRSALAEEHGALARGRRLRLRPVRHRRRPAADLPGLALRPLEGPDGRDRRLPARHASRCPRCSSRWSGSMATDDPEGWEFFHRDLRATRTATPTSRSSTTSTTSARSRSTPSSPRPTSCAEVDSGRASA